MTTTIAEFRALTTSTILINSFFLKVIVWMCLFTAAGIHRAVPASSAIQKRIAAQAAASSSIHKDQKKNQRLQEPSLALSLPHEIFAFDYFHQKNIPVAMLPRIKKKELLHKKESAASFGENTEEYLNSTAAIVKRSDFAVMETDREDFVLTSFAAPYDYFSHPLRLDYVLEETEIEFMQYKEENAHILMPSSWIDYVAGCEFHWNCGISFARGRGDLFLAAGELIIVLSALFSVIVARIVRTSPYCRRRKEESHFIVRKKKLMVMPPLRINCRTHHPHCRCLCRAKTNKFRIPHAPNGYKRVLVPTPGAKCGAREYIIVRELVQHQHVKPLPPNINNLPTLDPIPEVPIGYTRVLAPIPGTECGERDYIVVLVKESGKLLHEDDAASSTIYTPSASRKKTSRRFGMQERILLIGQQHQIVKHAKDPVSWIMSPTRECAAEFFPYAREITRKPNFLHGTVGECASGLGCYIERIGEEECIVDHLESLDESNHPSDVHVVDENDEEDGVQEDVVCNDAVTDVVVNSTTTLTCTVARTSDRPTSAPSSAPIEDAAADVFNFQADSSCSDDLKMDVNNDETLQQGGSGYYIDSKGRKRRFSLRILAKKSARIIKD